MSEGVSCGRPSDLNEESTHSTCMSCTLAVSENRCHKNGGVPMPAAAAAACGRILKQASVYWPCRSLSHQVSPVKRRLGK